MPGGVPNVHLACDEFFRAGRARTRLDENERNLRTVRRLLIAIELRFPATATAAETCVTGRP